MTRVSLRNPLAVLMASIAVVVFALVVLPRFKVDTFPELTPPVLVVGTLVPGLAAKDIEKTITWRIEKYVSATPGVAFVESKSKNNLSIVYVWLKWGSDMNAAQSLVQQQVAFAMSAVPKSLGVVPPFVLQFDPSNAPVVQVAIYGGGLTGPQLYDFAVNQVEPILEGISGVASASMNGGRQRQINVVVDPVSARAHGLTSTDVASAVAQANSLLPAGEFITPVFDSNVYTNAVAASVDTIGEAPVKRDGDRTVLIRDVARVEDGGMPETQAVAVNGEGAVYLNVLRTTDGNTLEIVDSVKAALKDLPNLPQGMQVVPIFDQSIFVRQTYAGLKKEIVQALVLVALVILLFLQSMRGTIIVSVTIPLSFAVTLIVLYASGETLNAFTLGGLTLAMGRLVDDAVVVLESIHRRRGQGMSASEAALEGARAVALPVIASTLTTIAVLLPIVFLEGLARRLFTPLAITVAVSMLASYVVSLCVTPVLCRYFLGHAEPTPVAARVEHSIANIADRYTQMLRAVLPYRRTLIVSMLGLVVASAASAFYLPSAIFPEIDESMERVYVRLAPGTSISESARKIDAIGEALREELGEQVTLVLTNTGTPANARSAMSSPNTGPHSGFVRLALVDPEERKESQRQLADRARTFLLEHFPGVEFLQWPGGLVASVFSNGYIAPLVVQVRADNLQLLSEQAAVVAEVARTVPGVVDIFPSFEMTYPEVHVDIDRQEAASAGVSARDAAQATLEATLGNINTPGVWVDAANGQSYYVVTGYDALGVADPAGLAQLPVRLAKSGEAVSLGTYAKIERSTGPITIERSHASRVAHVLMQTQGRDLGTTAAELEARLHADPRTSQIDFRMVGQVDLMRTTFSGLGLALGLAAMLIFMIMSVQFRSLRLPFVMLFAIPMAAPGIILALLMAGQGFSLTALMGVLMVMGIAVSNGILLVDAAAVGMAAGEDAVGAVIKAARVRFVPIMMTSLATVIGLLPTALGLELGAEATRPLALAVVGGLTTSTVLSLFVVPAIFTLLARPPAVDEAAHVA